MSSPPTDDDDDARARPPSSTASSGESVEWLDPPSEESTGSDDGKDDDTPSQKETKDQKTSNHLVDKTGLSQMNAASLGLIPTVLSGFQAKRSGFRVDSWVDLVLTLDGRDKVTKFLQYSARLLAWYYAGTAQQERFASLKQSFISSRKAFRFGRSIIELHRLKEHQKKFKHCGVLESVLHTIRYFGLAGFWLMDNTNFLYGSGVLDRLSLDRKDRALHRKTMQTQAGIRANQSYFVGSVAGFWLNWKALRNFQKANHKTSGSDKTPEECASLRAKYFGLWVALLKSVCDILVFSNNPGVDLWKKYHGAKMNELVHCVCGLTSASVVLYKNYPAA